MIESRRVNHRRSATVAATRFRMEGEGFRTFQEGADHNPEAPSLRRSRVLPCFLHYPWDSQLQGKVVPGSLACVTPPRLLEIRICSRPPDSAPCQPFHENSSWMYLVSCGQALVTPPRITKGSFVGSRLQLTACGWLDSLWHFLF